MFPSHSCVLFFCLLSGGVLHSGRGHRSSPEQESRYAGGDVCGGCHDGAVVAWRRQGIVYLVVTDPPHSVAAYLVSAAVLV